MTLIEVLVVLALVAAVAAVAVGAVRGGLDEPASTVPDPLLVDPAADPEAPVRGSDLLDVRFALALRGYRMDQVDDVLDRAADAIESRDEQIRRLRDQLEATSAHDGVDHGAVDHGAVDHGAVRDGPSQA